MTSWQDYKLGREDVGNPASSLFFLRLFPAAATAPAAVTAASPAVWFHRLHLNDEVSANAILKRATKHYTVVIMPQITA